MHGMSDDTSFFQIWPKIRTGAKLSYPASAMFASDMLTDNTHHNHHTAPGVGACFALLEQ